MKQMLVNLLTCPDDTNLVPTLTKCRYFIKNNIKITFLCSPSLKNKIQPHLRQAIFITIYARSSHTKSDFIFESLKRNLYILPLLSKKFSLIYSPSSVADLLIFPFLQKNLYHTKWVSIYDNNVELKSSPLLAYVFHQISLILLKKCDHIFVPTVSLKKSLINHRFPENKITVTGNGIENHLIKKTIRPKNPLFDAIFVGRLNPAKGIYDLLHILKIVTKKYPSFTLAIMGRGDKKTEKQFQNKIKQLKLNQNIKFLGFKTGSEKFATIKNSKIFLFPSYAESFGIALLEAVCCGLPALTYNLPVYKTIYKNKEIYCFPHGDTKSIAKKVLQIFAQKQFKNPIGKRLLHQYSWDKIARIELSQMRRLTA